LESVAWLPNISFDLRDLRDQRETCTEFAANKDLIPGGAWGIFSRRLRRFSQSFFFAILKCIYLRDQQDLRETCTEFAADKDLIPGGAWGIFSRRLRRFSQIFFRDPKMYLSA
jgi:hypothetical protein